ncbi:Type II secretory pathway component [Proteobacteria bacterium 005FR1]|nr:Type II secretory pathway component [Proteobacteria bacterium 005FR1]
MFNRIFVLGLVLVTTLPASAEALRDPTRPLDYVTGVAAEAPIELNSILIAQGRRIAVINGQEAAERERIGNILVLRILPNQVIVQRNGRQYELNLHGSLKQKNAS